MGLPKKSVKSAMRPRVEVLEPRQFLSADGLHAHPDFKPIPHGSELVIDGYTPGQIRHAYGFDLVNGDGTGQTIAIVDAYRHPNIEADLALFDQKFGIAAPPSFKIVGQTGGPINKLKVDSGWASEIAMDVEWAHAIAPNAGLLLVETQSDNIPDLLAGVDYARNTAGVSVISMSWGTTEWRGQQPYDAMLTTPAGHQGITFVASAGDEGSGHGPEWPSTSASVLSVGGTSLNTAGIDGTYLNETGWRKSTGGVSRFEKVPAYQGVLQSGGFRTSPDVSYNGDPNTGFAVYSSVRDGGVVGWSVLAGTSAGAPQWAAQVAVADQLRAVAGKGSLDGASGTLPALYAVYAAPNTAGYVTYAADFHDIVKGRSTGRWKPAAGYDEVTGLGSPDAPEVIYALVHADGGTVAANTASTPKTTRLVAHHLRVSGDADVPTEGFVQAVVPVARTASVIRSVGSGVSKLNFIATAAVNVGNNHSDSWVEAGRSLLPVGISRQFLQPSLAYTRVANVSAGSSGFDRATTGDSEVSARSVTAIAANVAANVALDMADPVASAAQLAETAVPMFLDMGRSMPLASFADAMADFAYESSALGSVVNHVSTHVRAWTVTAAMVAVDLVLIGYWRAGRQLQQGKNEAGMGRSRFSVMRIRG